MICIRKQILPSVSKSRIENFAFERIVNEKTKLFNGAPAVSRHAVNFLTIIFLTDGSSAWSVER